MQQLSLGHVKGYHNIKVVFATTVAKLAVCCFPPLIAASSDWSRVGSVAEHSPLQSKLPSGMVASNSFDHCSVQVHLSFVALVGMATLEFRQALTGIDPTRETQVHDRSEVTTVCASLWERNNHLNTCSTITRSAHTNAPHTLHPKETKKKKV